MNGYTASQLLRYHAYCRANPQGRVLPPGGQKGWDDMPAGEWLRWFVVCLTTKVSRGTESTGKGNAAKRRQRGYEYLKAECKWCGRKTGNPYQKFCDASCAKSYNS